MPTIQEAAAKLRGALEEKTDGQQVVRCLGPDGGPLEVWRDDGSPCGFGCRGTVPLGTGMDFLVRRLGLPDWRPPPFSEPARRRTPKLNGTEPDAPILAKPARAGRRRAKPADTPVSEVEPNTTSPSWDTPRPGLWARPFSLRDPASIPHRDHMYDRAYDRRNVSVTGARPGTGKTSQLLAEMVAMASGKPLLGVQPAGRFRCWYFSGEDAREETDRQLHALALHYELSKADFDGLFVGSGREAELVLARQTYDGATIIAPVREAIVAMARDLRLDVMTLDPFISTHAIPENDNGAIDLVTKAWAKVAETANASVMLSHHSRKAGDEDLTVDDLRGGGALVATARFVRLLNPMWPKEAERLGVERPDTFFKATDGKPSFFARGRAPTWFRFESVNLGNGGPHGGDDVGVVVPWRPADPFQGVTAQHLYRVQRRINDEACWRASEQADGWAGQVVAEVVGLRLQDPADRRQVVRLLATWTKLGLFGTEPRRDPKDRKERPFLVVKRWVEL